MIEDYYLHLYTEWKSKKENKEGSWKESKGIKYYGCFGVFILSCLFFIVMSIIFLITINNVSPATIIAFLVSIVVFMIMTSIMGLVSQKWKDEHNYDDFKKYLSHCIKLHDALKNDINSIELYKRILDNTKKSREELEISSKKPNEIAKQLIKLTLIALSVSFTNSITTSYLGKDFVSGKAINIAIITCTCIILSLIIWAGTYLYSKFDNKLIKTYKEMERDFQTIIDIHNNLFTDFKGSIVFSYDKPQL
ncbi:DUF2207 domain-containing protein [uncultured Ruminococcus sp.]|uniref:DUF2207 domain-containing protein n=1 Tax=uncultured Ruminococcus sp. TaxID=165186 RepID=UPI00260BDD2F|nr:DUF2207 domain-containing protein [uncultured Ruminococcus sp.]